MCLVYFSDDTDGSHKKKTKATRQAATTKRPKDPKDKKTNKSSKKKTTPLKKINSIPPHVLDRVIPASKDIGKTKIVEPKKVKRKKSLVSKYVSEILEQVIKDAFEKSSLKS